ncbi:hypothetical protein DIZ81_08595 [Legionella taurinensis]|uniref:Uncharacterized protein n=1 Tax=Legionella taurinensis TaxID=70611 RepID=A0A3A5L6D6_9GAMM|nr:hypothetical protein [Legionella taurinensis]MDX1837912.1 hypothetical protein [Legionella taurinensis]PUT39586.1 hypothetical protein DB744_08600 [Legionella taurinensis]PUT43281.1 hypothetical protein DB746_05925 [Legionella taurinensis]PUT45726.1 hypothetical protein DB743_05920 [Legionella taurinensis]PUT47639.1 hypothetical protein DB745_07005 [Legionella taurinensis]
MKKTATEKTGTGFIDLILKKNQKKEFLQDRLQESPEELIPSIEDFQTKNASEETGKTLGERDEILEENESILFHTDSEITTAAALPAPTFSPEPTIKKVGGTEQVNALTKSEMTDSKMTAAAAILHSKFSLSEPAFKKVERTETIIPRATSEIAVKSERTLAYTASLTSKKLRELKSLEQLYISKEKPNDLPRKNSEPPASFSQLTRADTVDSTVTPYFIDSLTRKNSQMELVTVDPSAPSYLLSRQASIDEAGFKASMTTDCTPPSRKPPEEPGMEAGQHPQLMPDAAISQFIIKKVPAPGNEFKTNFSLNSYTCWHDNTGFVRENVKLYKQKSRLESIQELRKLLEHLLENSLYKNLKAIEKSRINLDEGRQRSLNWLLLLTEISAVIQLFDSTTGKKFAEPLPIMNMHQWLPTQGLAHVLRLINVTVHEIETYKMIISFFALFADEKSKKDIRVFFLEQVVRDLKQIEKQLSQSDLDRGQFAHIKYLTIDGFKENSPHGEGYLSHPYPFEFADILNWLNALELPKLESVIIDDFIDNQSKSNFAVLVGFLQKNSSSLKTVILGKCFSEEDREILKNKLPTVKIAHQSETASKKQLGFFKKEPKPTLSPATSVLKFS